MSAWTPKIEIKKLKTFPGHDGCRGCAFDLWVDGALAAKCYDDAYGGGIRYDWEGAGYRLSEVGAKLIAWVKTLPPVDFQGEPLPQSLDMVVSEYIDKAEEEKRFRRMCSTKLVYRVFTPGVAGDTVYSNKCRCTPKNAADARAYWAKKGCTIEVLNETYGVGLLEYPA